MGLIKKLKKFLANNNEEKQIDTKDVSVSDDKKTIEYYCEQLVDMAYNLDDLNRQYKLVSRYFLDIQRIEEAPIEIINEVMDIARKIEMIDKARKTFAESEQLLTISEYNNMANLNDNTAVSVMKKMAEYEMEDSLLRSDMGYLEGEKQDLDFQINTHTKGLNKFKSIMGVVLSIFLLGIVGGISVALLLKKDMTIFVLVALLITVGIFAVYIITYKELRYEISLNKAKIKRAINLLNKAKAKYVNNINTLEYMYEKYGVNSLKDLEYQWQQYNIILEDRRKASQANSDLRIYNNELTTILRDLGLKDSEIWSSQTSAILDRREMVEIKHNLNVRRQKIRDRIQETNRIKVATMNTIKDEVREKPALKEVVASLLSTYHISV